MGNPKHKLDRDEMMAFLLGELEDSEESRIENMFLSDPGLEEELESVKTQLFQEYKSGRLTEAQSGSFRKRFLPDSLVEEKKQFQEMLDKNEQERVRLATEAEVPVDPTSAASETADSASPSASTPTLPAQGRGKRAIPLWALLAAAVLAAGLAAAVVLMSSGKKQAATQAEVSLSGFSVRGKSQVVALPKANTVLLRLPITGSDEKFANYQVTLLFAEERRAVASQVKGDVVQFAVERAALEAGRYDVELSGATESGESQVIRFYSFRK